ncbi:MAG: glycosyltransferase family 9 protein [Chthoniobacteraceae bacterium]
MKIAIFRPCGIGDFVQITPLLQQIKADLPQAEITFFTSENAGLFATNCPWAKVVTIPERQLDRRKSNTGLLRMWWKVRQQGPWDILLSLEPGWMRSTGSLLVPARMKAGVYAENKRPIQLYHHVRTFIPDQPVKVHTSETYLELWTKATGHRDRGYGYDIRYLLERPVELPALPSRFVCLVPGAGNAMTPGHLKRWAIERWRGLAMLLRQQGIESVWLGSPDDAREFPTPGEPFNLMGKTSLLGSMHIIPRAMGLIANDSGLYHTAIGLGSAAVGIFGPNDPVDTGPFRAKKAAVVQSTLPCVPCRKAECLVDLPELKDARRPYCLTTLPESEVLKAALALFQP